MKKIFLVLLIAFSTAASAQFKYMAWNLGIQTGSLKIKNGLSTWDYDYSQSPGVLKMMDSTESKYWTTNFRANIEILRPNLYIKTGFSLPISKAKEHNNPAIIGKYTEVDLKFAYGFSIKKIVGFQFGVNMGSFIIKQLGTGIFDYFVPSAGSTPVEGKHFFGNGAAWQIGGLVNNVIAFSDFIALRTTFSYNLLGNKRITLRGINEQLEFGLYYYNPEWRNFGFSINFVQNWVHLKSYGLDTPILSFLPGHGNSGRVYPATNILMTSIYLGINVPINFSGNRD